MMTDEQVQAGERLETLSVEEQTPPTPPAEARGDQNSGFMQPYGVSEELAVIVGTKPLSWTDITKKIWDYIKANALQDKQNRRNINCDDALVAVMGKPVVTTFEMTKLVRKHLRKEDGSPLMAKKSGSAKKKPSGKGQVKTPAAAKKSGKQPSLINATQSKLLSSRLDSVAKVKSLVDAWGIVRLFGSDTDGNPDGEFIAAAIRAGRLKVKSDLTVILVNLIERFADFSWIEGVINFEIRNGEMAEIFENPDEIVALQAEFKTFEKQQKEQAKKICDAVEKHKRLIERVLAAGTHTGEEITTMIDEFENMTFGGE